MTKIFSPLRSSCLLLVVLVTTSGLAQAEWFFRGTPNQWGTTQLTADGSDLISCQTFGNGDAGGGPRFKIDRFGDWSDSLPDADWMVDPDTSYVIRFTPATRELQAQVVADCSGGSSGFASDLPSLNFRGTANNWGNTAMALVADNTWELTVDFDGQANQRFKFDKLGDWSDNFGDNEPDGLLDTAGADIAFDGSGSYLISVNDLDMSYSLTAQGSGDGTPTTDTWFFRGTPNGWQTTAMASEDNVNFCTTQSFADGDAGGSPRFKIDHFGDWTESYPSTDYVAQSNSIYDICFNADTKQLTTQLVSSSGGGTTTDPTPSTGADFREETIYFLMTARFYDGDPDNNYFNRDRIEPGDPHWRGDFAGLIQQLDYIQDLGFTAIWVTPPVENRSGLDYHGYHAYDWMQVDPRLESPGATYQDFIDAVHARGMKVIQDVVVNHSSQYGIRNKVWIDHLPIKYFVPQGSSQGQISNDPYFGNLGDYTSPNRDDNDNPVAPAWFRERHTSDPEGVVPLVDPKTGVTVPSAGYDPNRFFGIDANTLDPGWYHLNGFMAGGDWENPQALQTKHMAGDTIDLATGNTNVRDYLNQAIKMYLDMGVDAIRLDTAKHIERDELLGYVHEWQAHKPDLFVFGEVLVKGLGFGSEIANDNASAVIRPWWYTRTGADPSQPSGNSQMSVLDFPLFSTFRDNVTRGSLSGIKGALDMDWTYADPTQLVTFFQNHDVGPDNDFKFRFCCNPDHAALAYNVLWTIRGIPTLYYGEEIMFMAGAPQDIQGNDDTVAQTGRAYFGPALDNAAQTQNHDLYQHIRRLNQIRQAVPALQKGQMEQVNEWGSGMSFVRNFNQAEAYALVGLATSGTQTASFSGIPNGTYRDAVTGSTLNVSNNSASFQVAPYSIGVYVLNGPGKIGQDGPYLR